MIKSNFWKFSSAWNPDNKTFATQSNAIRNLEE